MRIPAWAVLGWVIVAGVSSVGASALSYAIVRDNAADWDKVLELPDPPQLFGDSEPSASTPEPTASPEKTAEEIAENAPPSSADATPVAESAAVSESDGDQSPLWDDPRRVTVLLMGIDQRAGEEGTFPTDTIILFSLDPAGKTAALLSIPRDLWVEFPGLNQPGRINTANILGDEINYPGGGGPAFALKTVKQNLGVEIDFYALINFEVFITLVDAVGPIEVCPPEPIHDDHYPDGSYGYITVDFPAGCQELDAERLLQYARTRHSDSDIARSNRQQEVIMAVRRKVLSTGGVIALLPEIPALWESAQANIRTNLSLNDMIGLARKAEEVPSENIRQGQITFEEVYLDTTPDGEQVLVPIRTDIRLLIEDLFRPAGTPSQRESSQAG